jgi:hypothetical protein
MSGRKRGSNDTPLLSKTEISSETEPVMVSWYDDEIGGDEDPKIIEFLKRHEEFTDGRIKTKNVSWPEWVERQRESFSKTLAKFVNTPIFPEKWQKATQRYRQFNFEERGRKKGNPISISCEDNFIFHAEQIIELIKKLIERIERIQSQDSIIFINFLREMISLITDFLLFIRTSRCNKYQNENQKM